MKTINAQTIAKVAVFTAVVSCGLAFNAAATPALNDSAAVQFVAFSDSAEAGMLQRAYLILSTGDHDYKGHRVKAMRAVENAASLLHVKLGGDLKDHEKQVLSDEKLREARGLLEQVLGAAEVKNEKRISRHIQTAITHLNTALSIK